MQKFILFLVLSILAVSFGAFFLNVYDLQKNYFGQKTNTEMSTELKEDKTVYRPSTYSNYSSQEFNDALLNSRVIFLYFTSNWCLECSEQDMFNIQINSEMKSEGVVGLRVHILDSETTTETDALAKKFDITKENSFVILNKDGAVSFRNIGSISKEELMQNIKRAGEQE